LGQVRIVVAGQSVTAIPKGLARLWLERLWLCLRYEQLWLWLWLLPLLRLELLKFTEERNEHHEILTIQRLQSFKPGKILEFVVLILLSTSCSNLVICDAITGYSVLRRSLVG
jgi:hypothetical protein